MAWGGPPKLAPVQLPSVKLRIGMVGRDHCGGRMKNLRWILAALVPIALGACENTVYRDRAVFNSPADSTAGFLGYYSVADKQTACGNCHVGHQAQWATAKHASAWTDLQS